ncbi:HIT family protein [Streptococcus sp. SGI.013]|uniref:HIT family protein n=1 Tax=unclassified Streptococcus TaxID=2608887 RepID=UPI003CFF11C8
MCLICERIEWIKQNENPYFVKELETGYVVIGDHQHFKGYTLFLCKEHVTELHDLPPLFRNQHLSEMADVSELVSEAFFADKINIESLGNGDSHLHWHIFPRKSGDLGDYGRNGKGPVWWLPFDEMYADEKCAKGQELEKLKKRLLAEFENRKKNK